MIAVVFAINNRTPVTLDLWPWVEITAPVYAIALIGGLIGYCLGGFAAWVHAGRWRRRARDGERRAQRAEQALAERTLATRQVLEAERPSAQAPAETPVPAHKATDRPALPAS